MGKAQRWFAVWGGEVHPYVRTTQRQKWVDQRYKKYAAWKDAFRASLNVQDFPSDLDKEKRYSIEIVVMASGKLRCDGDNQIKAILDGAFRQDRRIKSIKYEVEERAGFDEARICLEEMAS